MTVTRTRVRQQVAREIAPELFTAATASANSNTTVTDIPNLGRFKNDELIGAWVYLPALTTPDRQITDNVQGTGVATFIPAATSQTSYELLPYSGSAMNRAIEDTLLELYDRGALVRRFWIDHWTGDSPIYNANFNYWSGVATVDGWSATTVTLTRLNSPTTLLLPGTTAVQFNSATGSLTLNDEYRSFLSDFANHTVRLRAWLRSDTASAIRAQLLNESGTVIGSTAYHSGGSAWELVEAASIAVAAGQSLVYPRIALDAASASNEVGAVWLEDGPSAYEYPFPVGLAPDGPEEVFAVPVDVRIEDARASFRDRRRWTVNFDFYKYVMPAATTIADEIGVIRLHRAVPSGYRLWMPCSGPLTYPSADANVMELSQFEAQIVAKLAAAKLVEADMRDAPASHRARLADQTNRLRGLAEQLIQSSPGAKAADAVAMGRWM